MVVLTVLPSPCSYRSTQGSTDSTTTDAYTSSKGKAGRPDQLWRVPNMSWARSERDSCAKWVRLLLSVYLRPRGEVGEVSGDAFAGANMAIEEGHGVAYFYEQRIHLDRLGLLCVNLYLYIYTCIW